MTTWLWIIGIIAVVWPVLLSVYLDHIFTEHLKRVAGRSESSSFAEFRAHELREEISKLQTVLEKQDALIAALWPKTFGFYSPGTYDGLELPEYLGVKPEWRPHQSEWAGPVDYLVRYERYPWGSSAKELIFPD